MVSSPIISLCSKRRIFIDSTDRMNDVGEVIDRRTTIHPLNTIESASDSSNSSNEIDVFPHEIHRRTSLLNQWKPEDTIHPSRHFYDQKREKENFLFDCSDGFVENEFGCFLQMMIFDDERKRDIKQD